MASILTGVRRFGDDGAFFDGSGFAFGQNVVHALAGEVVGHDVREFGKPEGWRFG